MGKKDSEEGRSGVNVTQALKVSVGINLPEMSHEVKIWAKTHTHRHTHTLQWEDERTLAQTWLPCRMSRSYCEKTQRCWSWPDRNVGCVGVMCVCVYWCYVRACVCVCAEMKAGAW